MPVQAKNDFPRLTDYLGQIIALYDTGETNVIDSDFGKDEFPVALLLTEEDAATVHRVTVIPSVVRRQLAEAEGDWLVGRLQQPGKAYVVANVSGAEFSAMCDAIEVLDAVAEAPF